MADKAAAACLRGVRACTARSTANAAGTATVPECFRGSRPKFPSCSLTPQLGSVTADSVISGAPVQCELHMSRFFARPLHRTPCPAYAEISRILIAVRASVCNNKRIVPERIRHPFGPRLFFGEQHHDDGPFLAGKYRCPERSSQTHSVCGADTPSTHLTAQRTPAEFDPRIRCGQRQSGKSFLHGAGRGAE